jgi:hypothetical protein
MFYSTGPELFNLASCSQGTPAKITIVRNFVNIAPGFRTTSHVHSGDMIVFGIIDKIDSV